MDFMKDKDIRVFYLMNGQIIFAQYIGTDEDTGDITIKGAVMVMIGQNKQLGMSTAYPFTHIDNEIQISKRQITTSASLDWNKSLIREYGNFWDAVRSAALKAETGIEVVPANAALKNLRPVPGSGPGPRPMPRVV
jgi:hypothetical protein